MGSFTSHPSTGLNRYPAAIALATVSLLVGAIFTIKAPTTGLPPTGTVQTFRLQNGSGSQVGACYDNGNCSFSGSVLSAGLQLATVSGDDTRYVNISGDTMTGALNINVTSGNNNTVALEIPHTASGRILHAQDQLRSSGSLVIETTGLFKGDFTTRGTASGAVVHASTQLRSSGTTILDGATTINTSSFTVNTANNIFSVQAAADQACNTTCVSACMFGVNNASLVADIVACDDATADECFCAGGS